MLSYELQFDPQAIPDLASRFSFADDAGAREAGRDAVARGYYIKREFLAVCSWKARRARKRFSANSGPGVAVATGRSFDAQDEGERMEALLKLHGVGVPIASALLHFAFPKRYPILDLRALEALGSRPRSVYPVSFWLSYLDACRELASRHGVAIRTLDKALWQWSKERSLDRLPESKTTKVVQEAQGKLTEAIDEIEREEERLLRVLQSLDGQTGSA